MIMVKYINLYAMMIIIILVQLHRNKIIDLIITKLQQKLEQVKHTHISIALDGIKLK